MELKQYRIVVVNLDPTIGSEIKKTRPCVIISPNEMNQHLNTLLIAPLTSTAKNYPTRVQVKSGRKNAWVVLDQLRTIDKKRVVGFMNTLKPEEIRCIKAIIKEAYVDWTFVLQYLHPPVLARHLAGLVLEQESKAVDSGKN